MSSDGDELLSPAAHAARFPRCFSEDEDEFESSSLHAAARLSTARFSDDEDNFESSSDDAPAPEARPAERSRPLYGAFEDNNRQWNSTLSENEGSMSEDGDSVASSSVSDDEVADQMRKEYEAYQKERQERARAAEAAIAAERAHTAATQGTAAMHDGSGVDAGASPTNKLQTLVATLHANRRLQECIREQLDKLEGARRNNAMALAEWQQDQRRVRQADRAMRGLLKRQHATPLGDGKPSTVRYRQGGSYFGKDAPCPGDTDTQQARRTVVNLVPLTYPSATKWSPRETNKLREVVRQSCQQRAMILLDQQTEKEDVAEAYFGASELEDEVNNYSQQVNELRSLTLLQLLQRLEEDGALGPGGALCGEYDGKDLLNWDDVAKRSRLRRTADDCRVHWSAIADPRIDVSLWTESEIRTLETLAEQHEGHSWERIAAQIGSGRRTAFACFQQYQVTKNKLGRIKWDNPTENAQLIELVQELGPKWVHIARRLGTGRKPEACMHRYCYAVGAANDSTTADAAQDATETVVVREGATLRRGRGKWRPEEDIRLEEAVKYHVEKAEEDRAKGIKRKRTGRLPAGVANAEAAENQIPW